MKSVNAPSRAPASATNFAASPVRSVKPQPGVCTVSSDDAMVVACTDDSAERVMDLADVMKVSPDRKLPQGAQSEACPPFALHSWMAGGHGASSPTQRHLATR